MMDEYINLLDSSERKQYYLNLVADIKNANFESTKGIWDKAYTLRDIVRKQKFRKDFSSQNEFARWLNLSSGMLSQYVCAVDFDILHQFDKTIFSVAKVYELSTLGNEYFDFLEYAEDNNIDIKNISTKELRLHVRKFKGLHGKSFEENPIVKIEYLEEHFEIPYSILKNYKVT